MQNPAIAAERRAKHNARMRQRRREDPEFAKRSSQQSAAHAKKRRGQLRLLVALVIESEGRCALCGNKLRADDVQVDHIIPVAAGGTTTRENLRAVCSVCNKRRNSENPASGRQSKL